MKKVISLLLVILMVVGMMTGCGENKQESANEPSEETSAESSEQSSEAESEEESEEESQMSDEEAAAKVAELIDAIYVQQRTDETDAQCEAAKAAWDALTEEQKKLVEGQNADPDYFGRNTGDASKDDPLNQDIDNENEILVVSFGTSFNDSRTEDIGGIEKAIQEAFPDWAVRRAFTSQIIMNHILARDGERIDNVEEAMTRAVNCHVKNLVIQPTHLMHGHEYDELVKVVEEYQDQFESIKIAEPLLGPVGADGTDINMDKENVATAVILEAGMTYGIKIEDTAAEGVAFVFMGHGTSHTAKVSYTQMQTQMNNLKYLDGENMFIGTVEGEPEETACEALIEKIHEAGYTTVVLRPLMVVAGDHANNDMAGDDEDSWKSMFEASGYFDRVETQIAGLGSIGEIQQIYVAHTRAAIEGETDNTEGDANAETLEVGEVKMCDFITDSSMFHVNDTMNGKGVLMVQDGQMMFHITLTSKNIVNLYVGKAEDAANASEDELLQPMIETVLYDDGTQEEVYGFEVPIPGVDIDFDLALLGTKGTWYDHVVRVSSPEAAE